MGEKKYIRILWNILKILIGLVLLYFSLRGIKWQVLGVILASVNWVWLILALVTVIASAFLKIGRWSILLRNYGYNIPAQYLIEAFFFGQSVNIILPVRGGEVVRWGWLRSHSESGTAQIGTTIALEKYIDLVMLVVLILLLSAVLPPEIAKDTFRAYIPLTGIATVLFIAGLWFGPQIWGRVYRALLPRVNQKIGKFLEQLDQWVEGSAWMRRADRYVPVWGLTTLCWALMYLTNLCLMLALHIPVDAAAGLLVLVMVYIGVLPALMPGNIGPFYFFASAALTPFNIALDEKIAFAVLLHACVTLPPLVFAGVSLLLSKRKT